MPEDIARETLLYQSGQYRHAMRGLGLAILEALGTDMTWARERLANDEASLERWVDDFNEAAHCCLCRNYPISADHDHVPQVL